MQPEKYSRAFTFSDAKTGAQQSCNVRQEMFLAPEVFFRPDFISDDFTTPLPTVRHDPKITIRFSFNFSSSCW